MFLIRSCGGEVSWHSTLAVGSTFSEEDPSITHQIIDRPAIQNHILTRTYLQVGTGSIAYDAEDKKMNLAVCATASVACCLVRPVLCLCKQASIILSNFTNYTKHLGDGPISRSADGQIDESSDVVTHGMQVEFNAHLDISCIFISRNGSSTASTRGCCF